MTTVRQLLTKLNLLTVGLIALTAVTITSFYVWQQWRDDQQQLRSQGRTVLAMLAELSAPALATTNKSGIDQILAGIAGDSDIAYVAVQDQKGAVVAERRIAGALGSEPLPAFNGSAPAPNGETSIDRTIGGLRFVELAKPVVASTGGPPIGYIRLGLSSDRQQQNLRNHLLGALTVVGLLVIVAVITTLLLTRGLVAPMRRL